MPSDRKTLTSGATGDDATHFRWDRFAAPERALLQAHTESILSLAYRTACDTVRIGRMLSEVKERLWGDYEAWVESELPFSLATAHRFRQVAAAFGAFLTSQFERFDPSALYLLSQLQVPQAVREHAVQLAEEGERITRAVALEILDAHKDVPVTSDLLSEHHERMKDIRAAEKKAQADEEREEAVEQKADHWDAFRELVEECSSVHVTKVDDPEDVTLYSIMCHRQNDRPRNVVRRHLSDAVDEAGGRERQKYCPGCCEPGETKPVGEFSDNSRRADGRNDYCKACEKKRRKKMRDEARTKKQSKRPAA